MRILPFVLGILLLQVPAHADKFWLSDPAKQSTTEGAAADYVHGVLIAESDEGYHVRVVGGELILPKNSVFKIEKDDLSIDGIVKAEKDQAEKLAAENREREMAQAAARRAREVKAVEASATRAVESAAQASEASAEVPPRFDPVVGVVPESNGMNQPALLRELQLAWNLTRDRSYLKLLRQVRRMR